MIKLIELLKEDWFDDYLVYEKKVFDALRKRFKINPRIEDDLSTVFGKKIEIGYDNNAPPEETAYAMIPQGKTFNLLRWGNAE